MRVTNKPRALLAATAACAPLLCCSFAAASDNEPEPPPQRRSGFVFSTVGGLSLGQAAGNPNEQAERYDPAHHSSTGLAYGYRVTPFLGGALTDWFTFGLGGSYADLQTGSVRSQLGLFIFRLELFPLFARGGTWRDVGTSIEFGAGATSIVRKSDEKQLAGSGVASTIGLGLFWEAWRLGHLALGPSLAYQHNWSDWFGRHDVMLGLKGTFYGGP
jgi:hypothetical protein